MQGGKWDKHRKNHAEYITLTVYHQHLPLVGGGNQEVKVKEQVRIRKLTPKEYFRLMDFGDEDFEKAAQVNSNSQLYKQAGNSIVVAVLEAIFGEML